MKKKLLPQKFTAKYGPWALVAGASEGLGAAFAEQLAEAGINLVLVARRLEKLKAFAAELEQKYGVRVRPVPTDLGAPQSLENILKALEKKDLGLLVYNAAYSKVGPFIERNAAELQTTVDVNVRGPLLLIHRLLPRLIENRGGIILMSSLSGNQGSAGVAAYAASKAFNSILGQSLWYELRPLGVDVTVCCSGAIRTPSYLDAASAGGELKEAPGTQDADIVARTALCALGRKPFVIPGRVNRLADRFMSKLLTREQAIRLMVKATRDLSA
jgi:uncharacterized protein